MTQNLGAKIFTRRLPRWSPRKPKNTSPYEKHTLKAWNFRRGDPSANATASSKAVGSSGVRDIDVGDRGRPEEEGELERAGRNALRRALGPRRAPASPEPVVEPQPLLESPLLQRAARSHGLLSTVF